MIEPPPSQSQEPRKGRFSLRHRHPRGSRFLTVALKLLVTALVIAYVVNKLGWDNIVSTCVRINPLYAFYGLVACVVSIVLGAVQWHLLLHRKELRITFRESFELYYIGMFFNNIGTVAGDGIKVAYIKKRHSLGKIGFAATFLDRFAGLLALSFFAAAGCIILLWNGGLHNPAVQNLVRLTMVFILLFIMMLAFLTMRRLRRAFFTLAETLRLPKREFIRDVITATGLDIHHFSLIVKIGLLSLVIQGLRISTHICSAAAFGILTPENWVFFLVFIPMVALVMIVPLPFGVRETFGGHLFALTGIQEQAAFLMQFMATFIGVLGSLWGGIEFMINIPRGVHGKDK
ncbi:MAG: flippase-like domain-containing protein [Chitinispirillaceae bacterium]|nr:flippase-like domain-containing protein [Chitinispirillaceae bacterium]